MSKRIWIPLLSLLTAAYLFTGCNGSNDNDTASASDTESRMETVADMPTETESSATTEAVTDTTETTIDTKHDTTETDTETENMTETDNRESTATEPTPESATAMESLDESTETVTETEASTESETVNETETETETDIEDRLGTNILQDSDFENGFCILGMDSLIDGTTVYKTVQFGENTPVWRVGQWWSAYNIKDGVESNTEGAYSLADPHKSLTLDKTTHALTLALDASRDIAQSSTTPPAKWPHFLLEQSIDQGVCPLKGAESVTAKLAFTVHECEDLRNADGLHGQFSWFIYIVDTNPASEGYRNFLWFGINLYCPPNQHSFSYSSQDMANGPGNFIYSLSSQSVFRRPVQVGIQKSFELDILPIVEEALTVAQSRGFMVGTTVDDCSITGMNLGWEMFDRWNVRVSIDDIGIYRK